MPSLFGKAEPLLRISFAEGGASASLRRSRCEGTANKGSVAYEKSSEEAVKETYIALLLYLSASFWIELLHHRQLKK
jgi:hypothetical protein